MRKWLALCFSIVLLCAGPAQNAAQAQKGGGRSYSSGGGGSSGRSYSSGSSGRGYSSSGSSSGRSYSSGSGGSTAGKGYSSGGGSSTAAKAPGSNGSSSGRSYGGGGGSSAGNPAAPRSNSSGSSSGGRAYSSGANPSRPPGGSTAPPGGSIPPSANPNRPPDNIGTSGKGYSAGGGDTNAGAGVKPSRKSGYDARAAEAKRQDESRALYRKGEAPATTYVDPKGAARNIDPRDEQIRQLRRDLDYERWSNRSWRMRSFYGNYYWNRPIVYYNDPYNSFFWWWLLDQSLESQALWAYHHRYAMDQARYNAMLAQNAALASRVSQLEAQNMARDPSYVPPNFQQRDLMYTDNYVKAAYNPQGSPISFWHVLWVMIKFLLLFALIVFLIWLVFFKRWGATAVNP